MGKAKLEFIARITTDDGQEIERREEQNIPESIDIHSLEGFMRSFDGYERNALKARNKICEDITQAWLENQAKEGVL